MSSTNPSSSAVSSFDIDPSTTPPTSFSTESYFLSQPPPPGLEARVEAVKRFVERWAGTERRVVVVTVSAEHVVHEVGWYADETGWLSVEVERWDDSPVRVEYVSQAFFGQTRERAHDRT